MAKCFGLFLEGDQMRLIILTMMMTLVWGMNDNSDWQKWVIQRDTKIKTGNTSFLNINDAAYISKGSTVFLDKLEKRDSMVWKYNKPDKELLSIFFNGKEALLKMDDSSFDLLKKTPIKLSNGLYLVANHLGDGDLRLRLHNPFHKILSKFNGLRYFSYKSNLKVSATFEKAPKPKEFDFQTVRERKSTATIAGHVVFKIDGKEYKLTAYIFEDLDNITELFVPFKDETTGNDSYSVGRYLDVAMPKGLETTKISIDFNQAYNPLCARSNFFNCVRVPGKALPLSIRAGEMIPLESNH